jgi:hypothetical protein
MIGRVLACASCIASAYGDRSFNWAYGALMLAPFVLIIVVGGVLGWYAGYRIRVTGRLRSIFRMHEETT